MRVWWGRGGDDSFCKDGNYDCCRIAILKCFLVGGGDCASGGSGLVAGVVVVVIGYWIWWWYWGGGCGCDTYYRVAVVIVLKVL